jgi:hypothetical protein
VKLPALLTASEKPAVSSAGSFTHQFSLPRRMVPGSFDIAATGTAGGISAIVEATATARLAAPAAGVVDLAWISSIGNSPSVVLIGPHTHLAAHFHFAALPRTHVVRVSWYAPGIRRPVAFKDAPAAAMVSAQIVSGSPLHRGVWRAVASVRGVVVRQASVRLR